MKILKKNTMMQHETNASKSTKTITINTINIRDLLVLVGVAIAIIGCLVAFWPDISNMTNKVIKSYNYENSGWTTKSETKAYPVSHIRIDDENEYYDENQLKAGYSLLNYKALRDKGDTIALNIIKTKALEGDDDNYRYEFIIDGIDYDSVDVTSDTELFISSSRNVFDKVEYKKGLDEPQVKVYYKLKYHYGKLKKTEMKYETTLVLPE